jgi:nitroimidazol reductase NimA-like FMN-containing flavoprotein (pyridoxamine 5'-phosphate oxidase superfamily)/GNAT superfamily N-acetyltransferase
VLVCCIEADLDGKCAHLTGLPEIFILVLFDVPVATQYFGMRKEIFRMERASAMALLAGANAVHLASSTEEGEPVLRVLHAVIVDDWLLFHGAPAGEKMNVIGRRAVVSVEEIVASIPSYFVDPERACPATTFYRSVQLHGTIERIDDARLKATMLAALMAKHQPEGGHVPIDAQHPLYRKAIEGILVMGVRCDDIDGKAKLGQNRTPHEITRIVEQLWARGGAGDAHAVDAVLRANQHASRPKFLHAPDGLWLVCTMGEADADEATELLRPTYWQKDADSEQIRRSLLGSTAWVGARDASGVLVATARAMSDGAKHAWIYDMIVRDEHHRSGLGSAVLRLLLDHPMVRGVRRVSLNTQDAQGFYERFGFRTRVASSDTRLSEMILERTNAKVHLASTNLLASVGS